MKRLGFLIIHCTDTPADMKVSSAMIRRWHTSPESEGGRGWNQVGYSVMIHQDGAIETLVPYDDDDYVEPWEITNGVIGMNDEARHVVYVGGGKGQDTRTHQQRAALADYVFETIKKHPVVFVAGHNQFSDKACPSFDVPEWCRAIGVPEENIWPEYD